MAQEQERKTLYTIMTWLVGLLRQASKHRDALQWAADEFYTDNDDFEEVEVVVKGVLPDGQRVYTFTLLWGDHKPKSSDDLVMGDVVLTMALEIEAQAKSDERAWDVIAELTSAAHMMFKIKELVGDKSFTRSK
jgi:hypothetical protein